MIKSIRLVVLQGIPSLLRAPVFAPKFDNTAIVMLHAFWDNVYLFTMPGPPGGLMTREK